MAEVVRMEHVGVALGRRQILDDVTFAVEAGELVGILGPNGAGKTTMLRAMLGLVPTNAGTVRVVGTSPRRAWRAIGYVPQRHTFAWDYPISVVDVVMTGLVRHVGWLRQPGVDHWRAVNRALAQVEMGRFADRTIGELSGGQKQRVLIARALATGPRVLVLDEPFTGIDMPTQELLTDLVRRLSADGTSVVMTTHDIAGATASCHRLALVNGTVLADGPPASLRDPAPWMRAFAVSARSPLLTVVLGTMDAITGGNHDAGAAEPQDLDDPVVSPC